LFTLILLDAVGALDLSAEKFASLVLALVAVVGMAWFGPSVFGMLRGETRRDRKE